MSLKVAIFEDDIEVAELLKEMMESHDFEVRLLYNLKDKWTDCDVILGDYRNQIVAFDALEKECQKNKIPLIAISGAETQYRPQLIKPFFMEDLQASILQAMMHSPKKENKKEDGFFANLFKKSA